MHVVKLMRKSLTSVLKLIRKQAASPPRVEDPLIGATQSFNPICLVAPMSTYI